MYSSKRHVRCAQFEFHFKVSGLDNRVNVIARVLSVVQLEVNKNVSALVSESDETF